LLLPQEDHQPLGSLARTTQFGQQVGRLGAQIVVLKPQRLDQCGQRFAAQLTQATGGGLADLWIGVCQQPDEPVELWRLPRSRPARRQQ